MKTYIFEEQYYNFTLRLNYLTVLWSLNIETLNNIINQLNIIPKQD